MKWNFIPLGALLSGSMTSFISSCNSSSLRLQGKKKRGKKEQDVNIQLHFWSHLFNTGNKFYVGFSHLKKQLKKKPHIRWELLAFQIILSHQTTHSAQFATVEFTVLEFTWIPTELYYVMWLMDRMFWARHSWTPLSSLMSDISHSSFYEVTFIFGVHPTIKFNTDPSQTHFHCSDFVFIKAYYLPSLRAKQWPVGIYQMQN